jgi:hypothetical protein
VAGGVTGLPTTLLTKDDLLRMGVRLVRSNGKEYYLEFDEAYQTEYNFDISFDETMGF